MNPRSFPRVSTVLYALLLVAVAIYGYRRPAPSFDRYNYASAVAATRTTDPLEIHRYALAQGNWGFPHTSTTDDLYANPWHMAEQLPIYASRPLYVLALKYLGLRIVSPLAYICAGLLLLGYRVPAWAASLIVLSPPMLTCLRVITPDMMATAVMAAAMLLLLRGRDLPGVALLLTSVWIRTDLVFLVLAVLAWLWIAKRLTLKHSGVLAALACLSVLAINRSVGAFDWNTMITSSFAGGLVTPKETVVGNAFPIYLHAIPDALKGLNIVMPWLMLAIFGWWRNPGFRPLLIAVAGYFVVHLALFPEMEERYFLIAFVISCAAAFSAFTGKATFSTEQTATQGERFSDLGIANSNADLRHLSASQRRGSPAYASSAAGAPPRRLRG